MSEDRKSLRYRALFRPTTRPPAPPDGGLEVFRKIRVPNVVNPYNKPAKHGQAPLVASADDAALRTAAARRRGLKAAKKKRLPPPSRVGL
jgi:hypothetical protein